MEALKDFGTRLEAVIITPLVYASAVKKFFDSNVCVIAQGRKMFESALELFDITTDFEFNTVKRAKILPQLTSRFLFVDTKGIW